MTTVPVHTASVRVTNRTNTWSSVPSVLGTESVAISWRVTKSMGDTPNSATITLHNLSQQSVAAITDTVRKMITFSPAQLIELLLAGASEEPAEITYNNMGIASVELQVGRLGRPQWVWFSGVSATIETEADTPDTTVTLQCTDTGPGIGGGQVWPPRTYAAGTRTVTVIADLIHAMGLSVDVEDLESQMSQAAARLGKVVSNVAQLLAPYTTAGAARAQVEQFFRGLNLDWMVLDGTLYILGSDGVLPGYEPIEFKPSDGTLLRTPRRREGGTLEVDTVLRPGLIPARAAVVRATGLGSASYRISSIDSSGATETGASVTCMLDVLQTIPGVF